MTAQNHPLTLEQTLTVALLGIVLLTGYIVIFYFYRRALRPSPRSVHMQIEILLNQYNSLPAKIILPMQKHRQFRSELAHTADDGKGTWSPDMRVYGVPVVCGEVSEIVFEWKLNKNKL